MYVLWFDVIYKFRHFPEELRNGREFLTLLFLKSLSPSRRFHSDGENGSFIISDTMYQSLANLLLLFTFTTTET